MYPIIVFYAENKINGYLLFPFTFQSGLRYEAFRPYGIILKGLFSKDNFIQSYNGTFLNPRINLSFNITKNSQFRIGYGLTSKSPPMGMIFKNKAYFDIVDTVSVKNPQYPDSNFSFITTYIREQANPYIKGYTQKKYEISFDQQFDFLGFSITAFLNDSKNMFNGFTEPINLYKYSFPSWPEETNKFIKDTLIDSYIRYINNSYNKVIGLEISLSTRKIKSINTIIRCDASYYYTKSGSENGFYYGSPRYVNSLGMKLMPIYRDFETYQKDFLLNYRFEIQPNDLGMWITLHIQQKLIKIDGRRGYDDTLAIGYFDQNGKLILLNEESRYNSKFTEIRRKIEYYELFKENKPNKWLINIKITKTLWKGNAISFYVNNLLNNRPLYKIKRRSPSSPSYERRNQEIFYGMELIVRL